jgi:hypothetical protein
MRWGARLEAKRKLGMAAVESPNGTGGSTTTQDATRGPVDPAEAKASVAELDEGG